MLDKACHHKSISRESLWNRCSAPKTSTKAEDLEGRVESHPRAISLSKFTKVKNDKTKKAPGGACWRSQVLLIFYVIVPILSTDLLYQSNSVLF